MKKNIIWFQRKHVICFSILVFLLSMPVSWLIILPFIKNWQMEWKRAAEYGMSVIVVLAIASLYWKEMSFSFKCPLFFKGLFSFGLLGVIGAVCAFVFSRGTVDLKPTICQIIGCVMMTLAIAVSEEVIFRGVILHSMLRAWRGREQVIIMAVVGSTTIFGLRHLLNLWMSPGTVILTMAQVCFTFMAGLYLCGVYLRTENIWVCICIHFLEDFGTSIWGIFSSQSILVGDVNIGGAIGMIALQIPYVIFAILMLRDKEWQYKQAAWYKAGQIKEQC